MPGANGQYTRQTVQEHRPQQPKREAGAAQSVAAAAAQQPKKEAAAPKSPPVRGDRPQADTPCRPAQDIVRQGQLMGIDSGDLLLIALLLLLLSEGTAEASPLIMTLALALIL